MIFTPSGIVVLHSYCAPPLPKSARQTWSHLSNFSSFIFPLINPLPSLLCLWGLMLWHLSHEIMTICLRVCFSSTLCELPEDRDCIHRPHTVIVIWLMTKVDGEWMQKGVWKKYRFSSLSRVIHFTNDFVKMKNDKYRLQVIIFLCFNMALVWSSLFIHSAKPLQHHSYNFLTMNGLV